MILAASGRCGCGAFFQSMAYSLALVAVLCLGRVVYAEPSADLRKKLNDPSPSVRKQAALTLAETNEADAIPVLIDLLAESPAEECKEIDEYLTQLAGAWVPTPLPAGDDSDARKKRRDAWMQWWRAADGKAQLAVIRQHTPTPELRRQVKTLLTQLGDDAFAKREAADKELHRLGRLALPQLREAASNSDPEVARRARRLIERLEGDTSRHLPRAAVRLVALRKPEGATAALLAYSPLAEEENLLDDVKTALTALALRDGKLDVALLHGLSDERSRLRALAAEALAQGGGKAGGDAVRKLLRDDVPSVRLRIALALARTGNKDSVPVLIDLLALLSDDEIGEAEEKLYQLAGDSAPETTLGTTPSDKKKRRDAWAAWWKNNAERADLQRLKGAPSLGYTVLCDTLKNRIYEIDRHGKERWRIENLQLPIDATVLPGNRVLLAEYSANRVTERDFKGKILWQKQIAEPNGVQRLPNGNTFIVSRQGTILEVDRAGKEVYRLKNVPNDLRAAHRTPQGTVVYLTPKGECVFADTTGKRLKSFDTRHIPSDVNGLQLMPNGHILISPQQGDKLVEYNGEGKKIREIHAPQASTAMGLPNGNYLVASHQGQRVYEVNRAGKIVWEHKNAGHVYQARRR
jgi:HEAT repeat protein